MEQINITYDLFLNAKDQINSIPPSYTDALSTLQKIPPEYQTMCIEHMKILCHFMLNHFEDIIEYYYTNKPKVTTYLSQNDDFQKLIACSFLACGMHSRAKQICPSVTPQYSSSSFFFNFPSLSKSPCLHITSSNFSLLPDISFKPSFKDNIIMTNITELGLTLLEDKMKFNENDESVDYTEKYKQYFQINNNDERAFPRTKTYKEKVIGFTEVALIPTITERTEFKEERKMKNDYSKQIVHSESYIGFGIDDKVSKRSEEFVIECNVISSTLLSEKLQTLNVNKGESGKGGNNEFKEEGIDEDGESENWNEGKEEEKDERKEDIEGGEKDMKSVHSVKIKKNVNGEIGMEGGNKGNGNCHNSNRSMPVGNKRKENGPPIKKSKDVKEEGNKESNNGGNDNNNNNGDIESLHKITPIDSDTRSEKPKRIECDGNHVKDKQKPLILPKPDNSNISRAKTDLFKHNPMNNPTTYNKQLHSTTNINDIQNKRTSSPHNDNNEQIKEDKKEINNEHSLKLEKSTFNIETVTKFNPKKYKTQIGPKPDKLYVEKPSQTQTISGTDRKTITNKK